MDDAWWGPTFVLPRGPWFCLAERNLPGSIMVNAEGRRFVNEAAPYVDAVHAMYDGEATGVSHVPCWMVLDQRYRNRYLFAGLGPRQPFPGRWYQHGTIVRSDTVAGLAEQIGVPADNLAATLDRFNGFAREGVDRTSTAARASTTSTTPTRRSRPTRRSQVIDQAPFYAVRMVPGDLGTKGGLVTDERARVLRADGSAITGLYAAGNCSAAVMGRTYPGPGGTIGPALTFGYLAALDLASRRRTERGPEVPIDPAIAVGAELPSRTFSWSESDVLLYHLGVGFGSRPGDQLDPATLAFTTESGTGGSAAGAALLRHRGSDVPRDGGTLAGHARGDVSLAQVVHGSQAVRLERPLPSSGRATLSTRISDVWDKGKAAVIVQESTAVDSAGEQLFTTRSSIFVRGEGGFGGERGPSSSGGPPETAPDLDTSYAVTPQQALLYRLCGDRNPLHADPEFAAGAGFPAPDPARPVLLRHRAARGPPGPARLRRVPGGGVRGPLRRRGPPRRDASAPAPGSATTDVVVRATVAAEGSERDGAPVLDDAVLQLRH